jgi:hypothetical protein
MRLSSVRELIAQIKEEPVVPEPIATALGLTSVPRSVRTRLAATHTRAPVETSIAVGIASGRSRGDFRLGARVQLAGSQAQHVAEQLRQKARGECDVRVVPKIRARVPRPAWFRKRRRPLEAGLSLGHFSITAGTFGFVVEDDDAFYVLSNNHVLANVNVGQPGDPVVQPGPDDRKPSPATLIGVLDRFVTTSTSPSPTGSTPCSRSSESRS